ncbi:hypothetical protein HCN44_006235 [Aphidius gifuensis]|uniref:Inositol polyphosphate 1-phosphatase n=1 Tax=Aphidius gifuensis TaxID=684658 RepID=A0A834XVZ5_APHGI|nr:inositol polyphosphate 1-phosphatase [Aphidius gifuensis]XP_044007638.1 inositol polyphosphate 1-phosphatase [Aphidius gifuensis]XP_044007639.1 inositol polyphosphate 1-phosphatase [Aphidius gifuensis]KAF7993175.1 hypothetical protein HCN44_006235 [Aphidius gifuensis]
MTERSQEFLEVLLKASEKAANIARVCRQNQALFNLLVQEKTDAGKNPRFIRDFKTLADVLIQESVRHEIGAQFPDIAKMVRGEETNVFSNTLGTSVIVEVCSTCIETSNLLSQVLDNDEYTANLLATEIHRDISITEVPNHDDLNTYELNIDVNDVGIWIDPIDSTADYITANTLVDEVTGLHLSGLRCVTVLIGAYSLSTGLPILGVVNQPFYSCSDENTQWKGTCYWGIVNASGNGIISYPKPVNTNNVIVISRAEDPSIKAKLTNEGFRLIEVAGAGYKILSVAIGLADAYILSKKSTYRWDTCAPQAILSAQGGGIIDFSLFTTECANVELKYSGEESNYSNKGGLIAYRDSAILDRLKKSLVLTTKL